MNNLYLFIIWNKALFCKEKIIDDLSNSFTIIKKTYMQWNKDEFKNNLMALYGIKATDLDYKIHCIGKGKFYLILVKDDHAKFVKKQTQLGEEIVNTNIYEKKWLYRKWTAGGFRIHSSVNKEETNHDLTILLGADWNRFINSISNDTIIKKDVSKCYRFDTYQDFCRYIKQVDNKSQFSKKENNIILFSYCKTNILMLNPLKKINNNTFIVLINNYEHTVHIFGVLENEITLNYLDNHELIEKFQYINDDYLDYLNNKKISNKLSNFVSKFEININDIYPCVTTLSNNNITLIDVIVSDIKYDIVRITSRTNKILAYINL